MPPNAPPPGVDGANHRIGINNDSEYINHCREKKWSKVAEVLVPLFGHKSEETSAQVVENALRDVDSRCVPTAVIVDAVSLCVQEYHPSRLSPPALPWPNSMKVTRNAVDSRNVAFQSVGNFLMSTWPSSSKLSLVKLLVTSCNVRNTSTKVSQEDAMNFIFGVDAPQITPEFYPLLCKLREFCSGTPYVERNDEEKTNLSPSTLSIPCPGGNGNKRYRSSEGTSSTRLKQDRNSITVGADGVQENCRAERAGNEVLGFEKSIAIQRGELVAGKIADGAKWVESGLAGTAGYAVQGIDAAGTFIKQRVPPKESPALNRHDSIVTRTYSDAAKRLTGGIRVTAQTAASGIRGTSALGLNKLTQHFHEREVATKIVPDREHRDVFHAVGTVGLATLGAVVVVHDALYDTSATVVEKTAFVASDIIEKRHGENAGKIAKDTCESVGNLFGTFRDMRGMRRTAVSKSIVKSTGKVRIKGESAMHQAPSRRMTVEYIEDLHQRISPLEREDFESCNAPSV